MSWGLFPNKESEAKKYVYTTHANKNNTNGTWMPEVYEFYIGYIHPPFFSKFEIQLNDAFMFWYVWIGQWFPIYSPFTVMTYFSIQRFLFDWKTIWYFWYSIFISLDDPNIKDYTLGNWAWYLLLSGFL